MPTPPTSTLGNPDQDLGAGDRVGDLRLADDAATTPPWLTGSGDTRRQDISDPGDARSAAETLPGAEVGLVSGQSPGIPSRDHPPSRRCGQSPGQGSTRRLRDLPGSCRASDEDRERARNACSCVSPVLHPPKALPSMDTMRRLSAAKTQMGRQKP